MSGVYRGDRRSQPRDSDRRRGRRVAARFDARLLLGSAFLDLERGDQRPVFELYGYTRDLGGGGVGLVIPSVGLDQRACAEGWPLRVALIAEGGAAELWAEVVHCRPLDALEPAGGFVIGARVTEASERAEVLIGPRPDEAG